MCQAVQAVQAADTTTTTVNSVIVINLENYTIKHNHFKLQDLCCKSAGATAMTSSAAQFKSDHGELR